MVSKSPYSACDPRLQLRRPGDRTRPGESHVLPCPGRVPEVIEISAQADGDGALVSRGPEAQIDFVELALARRGADSADDSLRETHEVDARR